MTLSKNPLYILCAFALVSTGQAMAGEGKIGLGGQQSNTEFEYITITGSRIGLAVSHIGKLAITWAGVGTQD